MHIAAKVAIGAGIVGGAALLLSACGREEDPQSTALDKFKDFDRNQDNNWTQNEVTRFEQTRPYNGPRFNTYRIGDYVFFSQNIQHDEITTNMSKAFAGARGNDAIASLQELTSLASKFDKDGNGTLSGGERRAFDNQYGPESHRRTIIDNTITGSYYSPRDYPDPDYPGNGGSNGPGDSGGSGNGPGDSGGSGGSNGPGDSGGGYTPPSNGGGNNGPGDGGGYTPPPNNGGSGGNSPGDSTDNGNPGEDDF